MKLFEINPIKSDDYKGGSVALKAMYFLDHIKAKSKPFGIEDLVYTVKNDEHMGIKITVWQPTKLVPSNVRRISPDTAKLLPGNPIARLSLSKLKHRSPIENSFEVDVVTVDEGYAGMGIAQRMYSILMQDGVVIISGESQTPDGRKLWAKISKNPNVDVTGYVVISTEDHLESVTSKTAHKLQDDLFGKLGAQHLGTIVRGGADYEFFEFPVESTGDGKQLRAKIEQQLDTVKRTEPAVAKLYSTASTAEKFETGLIARWIGG